MLKFRKEYIPFIAIIIILTATYFRMHDWYNRLESDRRLTVAHVYHALTTKSGASYRYIYQVGDKFYTSHTNGWNVNHKGDSASLQCFLIAYTPTDPTVHAVIWNYKFDNIVSLGTNLDTIKIGNSIKENIIDRGLASRADINDDKELKAYKDFIDK